MPALSAVTPPDPVNAHPAGSPRETDMRKACAYQPFKEHPMPAIRPRTTQKHFARHITRLYRENQETLYAYAVFIGESTEYVLNQLVETVLAKDREFAQWRSEHPESHVPAPGSWRQRRGRPTPARLTVMTVPTAPQASDTHE
jgi:hypothetical protein